MVAPKAKRPKSSPPAEDPFIVASEAVVWFPERIHCVQELVGIGQFDNAIKVLKQIEFQMRFYGPTIAEMKPQLLMACDPAGVKVWGTTFGSWHQAAVSMVYLFLDAIRKQVWYDSGFPIISDPSQSDRLVDDETFAAFPQSILNAAHRFDPVDWSEFVHHIERERIIVQSRQHLPAAANGENGDGEAEAAGQSSRAEKKIRRDERIRELARVNNAIHEPARLLPIVLQDPAIKEIGIKVTGNIVEIALRPMKQKPKRRRRRP